MNAITIIGAFAVAIGGLLTAVFGALKFNRGDAGETVAQFKEVLEGMRALLEETQKENERSVKLISGLREEVSKLEQTVLRLRETIDSMQENLTGEHSSLRETIDTMQEKLTVEHSSLVDGLRAEVAALEKTAKKLRETITELRAAA